MSHWDRTWGSREAARGTNQKSPQLQLYKFKCELQSCCPRAFTSAHRSEPLLHMQNASPDIRAHVSHPSAHASWPMIPGNPCAVQASGSQGLSQQRQHHLGICQKTQILRTHPRRPKSEACLQSGLEGFWTHRIISGRRLGCRVRLCSSRAYIRAPVLFTALLFLSTPCCWNHRLHVSVLIPFCCPPHVCVLCTKSSSGPST